MVIGPFMILTWNFFRCIIRALRMVWICEEMTDRTEASIRLNSSKQPHAPHWAKPEKIFPTAYKKPRVSTKAHLSYLASRALKYFKKNVY